MRATLRIYGHSRGELLQGNDGIGLYVGALG